MEKSDQCEKERPKVKLTLSKTKPLSPSGDANSCFPEESEEDVEIAKLDSPDTPPGEKNKIYPFVHV